MTGKTFRKTAEGADIPKASFAFLPCTAGRARAPFASQGGRPKGRTADT